MESKWLEDFVSLAETRSFSRSAELRHVTQPAFSRRIQSLEAWLGTDLIDRTFPHAPDRRRRSFYEQAGHAGPDQQHARLLRGKRPRRRPPSTSPSHTLSLTYMPKWLSAGVGFGSINTRLIAERPRRRVTIVEGGCDLLLCYHHPRQPVQLDASRYDMLTMGTETLRPYSRCDRNGKPDYVFPGSAKAPVPFLSYTSNAYLGRMVELMMADTKRPLHLMKHYETDMSESLKMMALEGHGVAFLPESSVLREVRNRQLARTDGPTGEWEVEMEIRLYRERPTAQRTGKALVARLWEYLVELDAQRQEKAERNERGERPKTPGGKSPRTAEKRDS
jgi:DNA-binding transcriptional LysR family regulator